jgi:hypothetical protein
MTIPRNLGNLAQGANSSGVLQPSYGGTGLTSPGTAGNVLVSNGTAWTSTAASGTSVGTLQYFSGGAAPATDASWLRCDGSVFTKTTYTALSTAVGNIPNVSTFTQNGDFFSTSGYSTYETSIATNGTNYYVLWSGDTCGTTITSAFTSTNGATWTSAGVSSPGLFVQDLQYLNNLFVVVQFQTSGIGAYQIRTSTNFNTWTTRTVTTSSLRTVRYLNSLYVTAGEGGFLATSTNAITWTSRTSGTASTINGLAYGGGLYAYCGDGGVIATSTDAITWTARTSNTTTALNNLIYANSKFNAIGFNATVQSTDGATWTSYSNGGVSASQNNLVYGYGNLFYARSGTNLLWSKDAIAWGNIFTTSTFSGSKPALTLKTSEVGVILLSGNTYFGATINPFTYNTSTQFVVPNQFATTSTTRIVTDNNAPLYIKAT